MLATVGGGGVGSEKSSRSGSDRDGFPLGGTEASLAWGELFAECECE
jgi:hypothetical protein